MRKTFAYLRVSSKGPLSGFPRQLKAIREYASAHAIRIVHVYREEGVSSTKDLDDRPALAAMIEL